MACFCVQVEESDDDLGPADEDLYASASLADIADAASASQQQQQEDQDQDADVPVQRQTTYPGSFGGPSVFGSMTLGMNRAVVHLNRAFEQMAVRAQSRRSLARPT